MKRYIAVVLAAVFLLTGCGLRSGPEKALQGMLDALRDGDVKKAGKYTSDGSLGVSLRSGEIKSFYSAMFGTISYVIDSTDAADSSAEVIVTVTMADMESLAYDATVALISQSPFGEKDAGKSVRKTITNAILSGQIGYVTNTATVYIVKGQSGWKIDMTKSTSFADAITGGLGVLIGAA